jgi:hypothetical protein
MIQLCNRAVLTEGKDGSTEFFQSDKLQEKLESSCRAAGLTETWMAEDIALAVEFSLGELGNDKKFTDSEIDSIVIKVLQEAGLGSVAAHYRHQLDNPESEISFNAETIEEIIKRYLHVDKQQLNDIVSKVSDAGRKLLLTNASPTLILELAKHYTDDKSFFTAETKPALSNKFHSCPWLISREDIIRKISGDTSKMVAEEVLKVSGVSRLFPSIRVEIAFAKFAESSGLTAPVTEFFLFPYLANLADAVDDVIKCTSALALQTPEIDEQFPVYLKFIDAPLFTEKWLSGDWKESRTCFEELVTELKALLKNSVFSYY